MAKKHQFLHQTFATHEEVSPYLNSLIDQGYTIIHWQAMMFMHSLFVCVFVEVQ